MIAGTVGDQGRAAATILPQARAQQRPDAQPIGGFDEGGRAIEIIRIGEREAGIAVSDRPLEQRVGAGRAL